MGAISRQWLLLLRRHINNAQRFGSCEEKFFLFKHYNSPSRRRQAALFPVSGTILGRQELHPARSQSALFHSRRDVGVADV